MMALAILEGEGRGGGESLPQNAIEEKATGHFLTGIFPISFSFPTKGGLFLENVRSLQFHKTNTGEEKVPA